MSPVLIPTLEPENFNGNPANYHSFIDTFDALISFNVPEPKRKLYFLLQYTTGSAHALVKGCQYMPGDQGYNRAREMLQSTFGQNFQIAKACTYSLINGPSINHNDKGAKLKFSAKLSSCQDTLLSIDYLHKMDNFDVLSKIAKRLPQSWMAGWQAELDSMFTLGEKRQALNT